MNSMSHFLVYIMWQMRLYGGLAEGRRRMVGMKIELEEEFHQNPVP